MPDRPKFYHQIVIYKLAEEERAGNVYLGTNTPKPTLENIVTSERVAEWLGYKAYPGQPYKIRPKDPVARIVSAVMQQCGWKRHGQRVPGNGPKRAIWVSPYAINEERKADVKRAQEAHAKWLKANKPLEVH